MNWQHVFTILAISCTIGIFPICTVIALIALTSNDHREPNTITVKFTIALAILGTISACLAGGLAK